MPQLFMWFDSFAPFSGGDLDQGSDRGPALGIVLGACLGLIGWLTIIWLAFN
ncbi:MULTISPECIES: hypothetical protein [unclassified Aureimonas]|uniref:hypothetical protein n=1 Tax=unclassified Aureimonas TaxID=2615206 RepID=UPI000ACD79CB|nr:MULTISPECIES: hypothetical protein [unclassified Aureimonas]